MFWYVGPQSTGPGQETLSSSLRMEGVLVLAQWGCTGGPPPSCLSNPCSPSAHRLIVLLSFKIERKVDYSDYIDTLTSPEQTSHRTNLILSGKWQRLAEKNKFKLVTCLLLWISEVWEGKVFFWSDFSSQAWGEHSYYLFSLSYPLAHVHGIFCLSVCLSLSHTHIHRPLFIKEKKGGRKKIAN